MCTQPQPFLGDCPQSQAKLSPTYFTFPFFSGSQIKSTVPFILPLFGEKLSRWAVSSCCLSGLLTSHFLLYPLQSGFCPSTSLQLISSRSAVACVTESSVRSSVLMLFPLDATLSWFSPYFTDGHILLRFLGVLSLCFLSPLLTTFSS